MAVMTLSEARAALPEVVNRVAQGEEITITRYGRPMAIVVRPDVVWSQPDGGAVTDETERLITTLRERARRHGLSLEQELSAILAAAEAGQARTALPPIRLTTVRGTATSTWSREEIYGDEGR
jgi:antitoxin (DNA-binding transcriptional repressor) of toxin-antitoxin stability system